jgi:prevent-host-death family protein
MLRAIGVDKARTKLGQLAKEVAADDEAVVLTHRGEPIAVLVSAEEYELLTGIRRDRAGVEMHKHLAEVRQRVVDAGLDARVVDKAIEWAEEVVRTVE